MKVSKRTEYGLRAMVALALTAGTSHPVPLPEIAMSEGIPEQFLDQIISKLRREGYVQSVRGVNGGYLLSRPASDIRIGSLVRSLEGSLSLIACVTDGDMDADMGAEICERFEGCHTRSVWVRVMDAVTKALDSISLADVMKDEVPLFQDMMRETQISTQTN